MSSGGAIWKGQDTHFYIFGSITAGTPKSAAGVSTARAVRGYPETLLGKKVDLLDS
jgi:hypothetical protein